MPQIQRGLRDCFLRRCFFSRASGFWNPFRNFGHRRYRLNVFYYHVQPLHISMLPNYLVTPRYFFWAGNLRKSFWSSSSPADCSGRFYLSRAQYRFVAGVALSETFLGCDSGVDQGLPGYPPTWEFLRNTLLSGGLFTGCCSGDAASSRPMRLKKRSKIRRRADGKAGRSKSVTLENAGDNKDAKTSRNSRSESASTLTMDLDPFWCLRVFVVQPAVFQRTLLLFRLSVGLSDSSTVS